MGFFFNLFRTLFQHIWRSLVSMLWGRLKVPCPQATTDQLLSGIFWLFNTQSSWKSPIRSFPPNDTDQFHWLVSGLECSSCTVDRSVVLFALARRFKVIFLITFGSLFGVWELVFCSVRNSFCRWTGICIFVHSYLLKIITAVDTGAGPWRLVCARLVLENLWAFIILHLLHSFFKQCFKSNPYFRIGNVSKYDKRTQMDSL